MKLPRLLKGGTRTPAVIQAEMAEREEARAAAQRTLDKLMANRPDVLINGTDEELEALDIEQRRQGREVERQAARIDMLRTELDAMNRAAEQARRRAVYDEAKEKADAAAKAISVNYPKIVKDALAMLKILAEAQIAVEAANIDRPADAEPLQDPELVARSVPGQVREIVAETEVELWRRMDMQTPVDVVFQDEIYALGKSWGKRPGDFEAVFRLSRFRKVEYRDEATGVYPLPLSALLRLPSPKGDGVVWGAYDPHVPDPALWATLQGRADPQGTLDSIAEVEAAAAERPVKRPVRIEWSHLGDVEPGEPQPQAEQVHRPRRSVVAA